MKRSTTASETDREETDREKTDPVAADGEIDFARDLPTTPEDIAVLRRLREPADQGSLERINELYPPELFGPHPPRLKTSEGWEPFTL